MRAAGRSSPAVPRTVQGHVALHLRRRRRLGYARIQQLRGIVPEGSAAPQEDAEHQQVVARLARAQVHGWRDVRVRLEGRLMLDEERRGPGAFIPTRFGSDSGASLLGGCDWLT